MRKEIRTIMLALLFLPLLLLAGCGRTPQSREAGSTAVIGVLGVEPAPQGLWVCAGAESRAGQPPAMYRGRGKTLAAAVEELSASGNAMVSCAHVEHILLAQTAAGSLEEVLSYAFQDPQQSTESQLWVVRTPALSQIFSEEQDPAQRMSVLRAAGKDKQGFVPVTLREAASALAKGDPLLIPALDVTGEGISFGGYALYKEGEFAAWLTGEAALGAALLKGDPIHWTDSVGDRAISLQSTGRRVEALWNGDALAGLAVRCDLEGVVTGGWASGRGDQAYLEAKTARAMDAALKTMQRAAADGADLKGGAGLRNVLDWRRISEQWEGAFSSLTPEITVEITLEEP